MHGAVGGGYPVRLTERSIDDHVGLRIDHQRRHVVDATDIERLPVHARDGARSGPIRRHDPVTRDARLIGQFLAEETTATNDEEIHRNYGSHLVKISDSR
jgi:hypothetical protein